MVKETIKKLTEVEGSSYPTGGIVRKEDVTRLRPFLPVCRKGTECTEKPFWGDESGLEGKRGGG